MQQPIIPLLIFLISGLLTGYLIEIPGFIAILLSLASLTGLLFSLVKKRKVYIFSFIILSLFFFGILNINFYLHPKPAGKNISQFTDKEKVTIEGVICKNPEVSPHKIDLVVATKRIINGGIYIPTDEKILLSVRIKDRSFKCGDYIRAKVLLRVPHNFNNPGGFDYKRYLLFRGIRLRGSVNNPTHIVVIRENTGNILKSSLEGYRTKLRKIILEHSSSPESKILQALILGEKREIPGEIRENFNRTGISHVLAISGLHIGIIAFLSFIIIRWIMKTSGYLLLRFNIIKVSALYSIIPIMSYALIAGYSISTIRATIMILCFLIAILIGRERDLLNTLAFAAFLILAFSPVSLFDVSFQLSFIAVAAILIITPALNSLLPKWKMNEISRTMKIVIRIVLFIFVSFSAAIGTAPLIAFYFNRISTMTLLSNLLIIPIIGFIVLPVGLFAAAVLPLSAYLAGILIKISSFFICISNYIIDYLSHFSFSSFTVTNPSILEVFLYYAFIFLSARLIHSRRAKFSIFLAVIALFYVGIFAYINIKAINPGKIQVTFIDVGQGSSTLVRFPGGKNMLIDGGGFYGESFDVGRYVVAPYLWHERIKRVDLIVLTHPHQDHLAGLVFILKNFAVNEVWSNGKESESESYKEFTRVIAERGIPHRIVSSDTPEKIIGGATVRIIHPPKAGPEFDTNNNSVVMKIGYNNIGILLPADIEEPAEKFLMVNGADMKSAILLAPHHGAYTAVTPSFLGMVHPEFIVSSCGKDNFFGYPRQELLNICGKMGVEILRTDENGAVSFTIDGTDIRYSCYVPRESVRE